MRFVIALLAVFILGGATPAAAACSSLCESGPRCDTVCLPGEMARVRIAGFCVVKPCRWCCGAQREQSRGWLRELRAETDVPGLDLSWLQISPPGSLQQTPQ